MLCPECKRCQLVERIRTIQHTESGYPNVILQGVQVGECPECQAEVVNLKKLPELNRLIETRLSHDKHEHLTLTWQNGRWVED